jgi:Rrf2 family iron-sulfur cluster assembly transcriptional regulator
MERLAAAALGRPGSVRTLDALAAEIGTSVPALEQVAHFLRLAGLLEAPQGRSGGIRLSRPASEISVLEVVRAFDGEGLWAICILGLAKCSDDAPCPAHLVWQKTRELLSQHLESQSLADLTRAVAQRRRVHRSSRVRSR